MWSGEIPLHLSKYFIDRPINAAQFKKNSGLTP